MADLERRRFFSRYLVKQAADVVDAFKQGSLEAEKKASFDRYFDTYESCYALALAYPDDLIIETARLHGIPTDGREKKDIVKELFLKASWGPNGF